MSQVVYQSFLQDHQLLMGSPLVDIYHAVRNIPYGSDGERDPVKVAERRLGSCSGKHILLRDLLRSAGYEAEIVTIFTHFNKGFPDHQALPSEMRRMIREEIVCDFHHYVRAKGDDEQWRALDATWHDKLIPYGFSVNRDWDGAGDTQLASVPLREYPPQEDIISLKAQLLETLSEEERVVRLRFLKEVTDWIATIN